MTDERQRSKPDDILVIEQIDLDDLGDERIEPEIVPANGDLRYEDGEEISGDLDEEDDDNPYQDSDEALPDDKEERSISRNPSREGGLFDEA